MPNREGEFSSRTGKAMISRPNDPRKFYRKAVSNLLQWSLFMRVSCYTYPVNMQLWGKIRRNGFDESRIYHTFSRRQ